MEPNQSPQRNYLEYVRNVCGTTQNKAASVPHGTKASVKGINSFRQQGMGLIGLSEKWEEDSNPLGLGVPSCQTNPHVAQASPVAIKADDCTQLPAIGQISRFGLTRSMAVDMTP